MTQRTCSRQLTAAAVTWIISTSAAAQIPWPEQLDVDLAFRNSAVIQSDQRWDIRLGTGFEREPTYQGSDAGDTEADLFAIIAYRANWGNLFFSGDGLGFSRMLTERFGLQLELEAEDTREIDDDHRLIGLGNQDEELELEVIGNWFFGPWSLGTSVALASGDKGTVWFLGGKRTWRFANDRLFMTLGADLSGSNENNQQTDFGVTAAQSLASGFDEYSPGGGLKSFGLNLGAEYQLNQRWFLRGELDLERLLDDVADSPIVFDDNNIEVGFGFIYKF